MLGIVCYCFLLKQFCSEFLFQHEVVRFFIKNSEMPLVFFDASLGQTGGLLSKLKNNFLSIKAVGKMAS